MRCRLILWRGARHSGKTTAAGKLAEQARDEGFRVAGLLAPSIYVNGCLSGFEALDLRSGARAVLTGCKKRMGRERFVFTEAGLRFGRNALNVDAVKSAELIIVDEFGPLEIAGNGWRRSVDLLLTSTDGLVVLVVRDEVADEVKKLYAAIDSKQVVAGPQSVTNVMEMLRERRGQKDV
jgi:nucleoside-triphosphatase THEP1